MKSELRRFLSAELAVSADAPIIGDDPRAPVEVDEQLMCESCLAIVDHIMTDLKKKVRLARSLRLALSQLLPALPSSSSS